MGTGPLSVAPPPSRSAERYLEAIYVLQNTGGAIAARVAERLGVRPPSATQALRRLQEAGWLRVGPEHTLQLTDAGAAWARHIMRRHRVLERWLVDGLGLDWAAAHEEAQRMEHSVSATVIDRLYEALGRPAVCPHGNPIPGVADPPRYAGTTTLARAAHAGPWRVVRIAEDAEEHTTMLRSIQALGLRPGLRLIVVGRDGPQVSIRGDGPPRGVPLAMAEKIWLDPL